MDIDVMATFHTTTSEPSVPLSRQLFSVRAAAAYLGVSPSTVRRRIAAGAVRAHRWGRTWMLWRDDLDWYCTGLTSAGGGVGSAAMVESMEARGLESVVAAQTKLGEIDGTAGTLGRSAACGVVEEH
jgi:excisionase family DNA binding protein